jgi:hypothetical protein
MPAGAINTGGTTGADQLGFVFIGRGIEASKRQARANGIGFERGCVGSVLEMRTPHAGTLAAASKCRVCGNYRIARSTWPNVGIEWGPVAVSAAPHRIRCGFGCCAWRDRGYVSPPQQREGAGAVATATPMLTAAPIACSEIVTTAFCTLFRETIEKIGDEHSEIKGAPKRP